MNSGKNTNNFVTRLAVGQDDLGAVQRLRYNVFVEELGAAGSGIDHNTRQEKDRFDKHAEHLMLLDLSRPKDDQLVGVYRLLDEKSSIETNGFYSQSEFDLGPLVLSGKRLLEAGRSCLHADYRNGPALHHLWSALARYVLDNEYEVLFGVASYPTSDIEKIAGSLTYLSQHYLAAPELLVQSKDTQFLAPTCQTDRLAAMRQTPALIKAYLRLGGRIGQGAYIDREFGTIDVCMILDVTALTDDTIQNFRLGA